MRVLGIPQVRRATKAALSLLLVGCAVESAGAPPVSSGGGGGSAATAGTAGSTGTALGGGSGGGGTLGGTPGHARCRAPSGVSASPQTVEEAVALLNALPKPTSVACFVESLDRPLHIFATSSTISAQPAFSFKSPRVFLRLNKLLLSVVVDGESSGLIEFSDLIDDDARSIKGELALPLLSPVSNAAPYERVHYNEGTVCGICHGPEERVESIGYAQAYASVAFRPNTAYRVSLPSLLHERDVCNALTEANRCEMLGALFDYGPVSEAQFSETMTLFF